MTWPIADQLLNDKDGHFHGLFTIPSLKSVSRGLSGFLRDIRMWGGARDVLFTSRASQLLIRAPSLKSPYIICSC